MVAPTYRCGAVPAFHRIPSYDGRPWRGRPNQCEAHPTYATHMPASIPHVVSEPRSSGGHHLAVRTPGLATRLLGYRDAG
ncbi:conserved hypothetical protein [Frankia canadensis]|uniref:Uncharacterized protein n=1 Tax=Frankia canadensis TaxID=1836972 RepID=A0A2I2KZV5_9ACTN|nr:conserved hypothetical protein [Frankia canadensis]SOU58492.1 conserved hypothetical protein [Frankia canadensis]